MTATEKPPCSICGKAPVSPKRYFVNDDRVLCQVCIETALRLFCENGVVVDGVGPATFTHRVNTCCLCGKAPGPETFFITNPPHGSACGPCVEESAELVRERRAEIAADDEDLLSDDTVEKMVAEGAVPKNLEQLHTVIRKIVKPGYLHRAKLSPRQQSLVLDLLAPRPADRPAAPVSTQELIEVFPALEAFQWYATQRLKPAATALKQSIRDAADRPLSPEDRAAIFRKAIPRFLACLGSSGSGPALAQAFLTRFAEQVAAGGPLEMRGPLVDLLGPELRAPVINKRAAEPAQDRLLVDSLIRPTLTRLKQEGVAAEVTHGERSFLVTLVFETPEGSKGPVKLPYRVAVLITQDHLASLAAPSERPRMLSVLRQSVEYTAVADHLQLAHLGPLAPVLERAVGLFMHERKVTLGQARLAAVVALLAALLRIATDDEKVWMLRSFFNFDVRGLPPPAGWAPGQTFDDWFLDAVIIPSLGAPRDDLAFQKALRLRDSLTFSEKTLLLKAYCVASSMEVRALISNEIDRPVSQGRFFDDREDAQHTLEELLAIRASNVADLVLVLDRWLAPTLIASLPDSSGRYSIPYHSWRLK